MNAFELLQDFRSRGVLLEVQAGKLRFAPRDAVTPELRDALREHKADLLVLLAEPAEAAEPAELKTGTAVPVLTEPTEPDDDLRRRKSSPGPAEPENDAVSFSVDTTVAFLEATERILVTWKDERPPVLRTPQLKREFAVVENALSKFRAALLPDDPESRAVGESLADRYGPERI
jgi:hypothetical protein